MNKQIKKYGPGEYLREWNTCFQNQDIEQAYELYWNYPRNVSIKGIRDFVENMCAKDGIASYVHMLIQVIEEIYEKTRKNTTDLFISYRFLCFCFHLGQSMLLHYSIAQSLVDELLKYPLHHLYEVCIVYQQQPKAFQEEDDAHALLLSQISFLFYLHNHILLRSNWYSILEDLSFFTFWPSLLLQTCRMISQVIESYLDQSSSFANIATVRQFIDIPSRYFAHLTKMWTDPKFGKHIQSRFELTCNLSLSSSSSSSTFAEDICVAWAQILRSALQITCGKKLEFKDDDSFSKSHQSFATKSYPSSLQISLKTILEEYPFLFQQWNSTRLQVVDTIIHCLLSFSVIWAHIESSIVPTFGNEMEFQKFLYHPTCPIEEPENWLQFAGPLCWILLTRCIPVHFDSIPRYSLFDKYLTHILSFPSLYCCGQIFPSLVPSSSSKHTKSVYEELTQECLLIRLFK